MYTPGDVGVRKPQRSVTSIGVLDGGFAKTPNSLIKIINEADYPVRKVTPLSHVRSCGIPDQTLPSGDHGEVCSPACARSVAGPIEIRSSIVLMLLRYSLCTLTALQCWCWCLRSFHVVVVVSLISMHLLLSFLDDYVQNLLRALICAYLNCTGKNFCARQLLSRVWNSCCMTGHASLTICTSIRSRPGPLVLFRLLIIAVVSSIVKDGESSVFPVAFASFLI